MHGEKFSEIGSFETEETRRIHEIDADLIPDIDALNPESKEQSANQPEQEEILNTRNELREHVAERTAALEATMRNFAKKLQSVNKRRKRFKPSTNSSTQYSNP